MARFNVLVLFLSFLYKRFNQASYTGSVYGGCFKSLTGSSRLNCYIGANEYVPPLDNHAHALTAAAGALCAQED